MIHNDGNNAEVHVTADESGFFKAPLLEPGTYAVSVAAEGFGPFRANHVANHVMVQAGQLTTVAPHLAAGGAKENVQVTADAPILNFEGPDMSANLNQKALENIPINNRRWSALALLTPGVTGDSSGFGLVSVRSAPSTPPTTAALAMRQGIWSCRHGSRSNNLAGQLERAVASAAALFLLAASGGA